MTNNGANMQLVGETLARQYRLACELLGTHPLSHFTHQLSQAKLELNLSTISLEHLEVLCNTIKNKTAPVCIHIYFPADKQYATKVVEQALRGVSVCLTLSPTLSALELWGIKLKGKCLSLLCQGLSKSRNLKLLHLRKCFLGNVGTEQLCQAIKNVPSITQLTLADCMLAEGGAQAIANMIKHQKLNRDSAMWQDSLRLHKPNLDSMRGLRRISLNNNPRLGDEGAVMIAEALTEDLWIKAVDLQHCGIGPGGGQALKQLLTANQSLVVLDLRRNPFLPAELVEEVRDSLQQRLSHTSQYQWLYESDVEGKAPAAVSQSEGYSASGRISKAKKSKLLIPNVTLAPKLPQPPRQVGIPWRVEHRLFERREGLTPGALLDGGEPDRQQTASHQATQPATSWPTTSTRKKLSLYKKKYKKEKKQRLHLEHKLAQIQTRLRGTYLLDAETVLHIEESFHKFQAFLTHFQNVRAPSPTSAGHEPDLPQPEVWTPAEHETLPPTGVPAPFIIHTHTKPVHDPQCGGGMLAGAHEPTQSAGHKHISRETIKCTQEGGRETMPVNTCNTEESCTHLTLPCTSRSPEHPTNSNHVSGNNGNGSNNNNCTNVKKIVSEVELVAEVTPADVAVLVDLGKKLVERSSAAVLNTESRNKACTRDDSSPDDESLITLTQGAEDRNTQPGHHSPVHHITQVTEMSSHSRNYNENIPVISHGPIRKKLQCVEGNNMFNKYNRNINNKKQSVCETGIIENVNVNAKILEDKPKQMKAYKDQANTVLVTLAGGSRSLEGSESDDHRLRSQRASARGSSRSSSLSIYQQLSEAHSHWSDPQHQQHTHNSTASSASLPPPRHSTNLAAETVIQEKNKDILKNEYNLEYASDFEVSDVEGISISATSLTTTSIPDDLLTPGEENF